MGPFIFCPSEFTAGDAARNDCVNAFGYVDSAGALYVVQRLYGGFQHLLITYRDLCCIPSGHFYLC